MAAPSDLDRLIEFLTVGPFGGLDPTTNPYYVAPTNFVDGENFVPNHGYGGLITVMGRTVALGAPLPGPCNGMHVVHRPGVPDIYLFALDIQTAPSHGATATIGAIYWAPLGGIAIPIALPETLTPGQQTFFADCQSWIFITNGVDRPLKIDTSLAATYWGIIAPTAAPLPVSIGPGPLLGTYNYCYTWGNDVQESSQGVISAPITVSQASAVSGGPHTTPLVISGRARPGDVITIYVGSEGQIEYGVSYTVPDPAEKTLQDLATDVATNFNASVFVTQYATAGAPTQVSIPSGTIQLTAAQPGASGNLVYYYGKVDNVQGSNLTIAPKNNTFLTGGASGGTIQVNTPSGLVPNDPQVTQLNLYRIGGSLGTWNLITTLTLDKDGDLPGHYIDANADATVTGQQLIIFRDPPPAFSYIATHMERVFGFGINNEYAPTPQYDVKPDPSVMWWSNLNEPWGFNAETNNFTCGDNKFSDVAAGLMEMGGVLLANKSRRCYFIYGSTDDDFQPVFAWFIGCDAPLSIATGYGYGFWHSRQGFHMTDGYNKSQISDAGFQQSNVKNILDSLTAADFAKMCSFMYDRQYYASFPTRNKTLIFDTRDQQWYQLGFACSQVSYDLESDVPVVAMDDKIAGQVDVWFNSPCDLDGTVTARLVSRTTDGGNKAGTKRLERALLVAPIQPGVCAKVIVTGDPDCISQVTAPQTVDLGEGYQRHEWGISPAAGGTVDCDTFKVTLCVDGPAIIDTVAVYGWVVRTHALPGVRTDFEGGVTTP